MGTALTGTCECGATFRVPDATVGRVVKCACGRDVVLVPPLGFHVRIDGREYGPYDEETLRRWAAEGRLPRTAELSEDGTRWQRAGERSGLFGAAAPAARPAAAVAPDGTTSDDRQMGLLAHILGLFTGFLGPLILFLATSPDRKFVRHHAKQALIWHGFVVALMAVTALIFVVGVLGAVTSGNPLPIVLVFLFPAGVGIASLVFCIVAAMSANRGEWYRYPLVGRMFGG